MTAGVLGALDVPVHSEPYRVDAAATIAYARATNDDNPAHLTGRLAPPVFAVVPALKTLVRAKRLAMDAFTLHGEHDIRFHRPIVPGMTLTVEARLVGVRTTPAGTTLIVHGLCTMAFVSRAVVAAACATDSRRLKRLAVRFSNLFMMRPGQRLLTTIWRAGGDGGRRRFGCEAADPAGTIVIRHGWAEVDDAAEGAETWRNR